MSESFVDIKDRTCRSLFHHSQLGLLTEDSDRSSGEGRGRLEGSSGGKDSEKGENSLHLDTI